MLRLPRKSRRRPYSTQGGALSAAPVTQNDTEVLQVAAPATQNDTEVLRRAVHATQKQPPSIVLNRRRTSADLSGAAPNAAPATQKNEMLGVLHLPRKMRLKCCSHCHAKAAGRP